MGVAGILRRAREEPLYGLAFCGLALPGLFWTAAAAASFPAFPNQFGNPLAHFALRLLAHGCVAPSWLSAGLGVLSLLPFAAATLLAGWRLSRLAREAASDFSRARAGALAAAIIALQCLIPEKSEHRAVQERLLASVAWDMGCGKIVR
jgi:hypothetical protein